MNSDYIQKLEATILDLRAASIRDKATLDAALSILLPLLDSMGAKMSDGKSLREELNLRIEPHIREHLRCAADIDPHAASAIESILLPKSA